jgi:hypothetical protein
MTRKIATFYLLAMLLSFMITLWVGARGASVAEVFSLALLAWPGAFFVMLARDRATRLLIRHEK